MSTSKPCSTPISSSSKLSLYDGLPFTDPSLFRSLLGGLQYLCHTRADICFAVNKLSQFQSNPLQPHWIALKRILRYLRGTTDNCLLFKASAQPLQIHGFSDSDWASSIDDRKSTSGGCVFLGGNLVYWSSKKQQVVARSSTEAEYRALSQLSSEILWLSSLLREIGYAPTHRPTIWCDNNGARSLAQRVKAELLGKGKKEAVRRERRMI